MVFSAIFPYGILLALLRYLKFTESFLVCSILYSNKNKAYKCNVMAFPLILDYISIYLGFTDSFRLLMVFEFYFVHCSVSCFLTVSMWYISSYSTFTWYKLKWSWVSFSSARKLIPSEAGMVLFLSLVIICWSHIIIANFLGYLLRLNGFFLSNMQHLTCLFSMVYILEVKSVFVNTLI